MALYGLLGDQSDLADPERVGAVNELMARVYSHRNPPGVAPRFASLAGAWVEVYLPENDRFQQFLRADVFAGTAYHPYADRRATIEGKLDGKRSSLEGNTNLDALITGKDADGRWLCVFVEAKFLSDISKDITYLPVRNQIARNIDWPSI